MQMLSRLDLLGAGEAEQEQTYKDRLFMARRKALVGLEENPRRKQSWVALLEVDNCAQALGPVCQAEIGISYNDLNLVLGRLAAAVAAGKCDQAYIARLP